MMCQPGQKHFLLFLNGAGENEFINVKGETRIVKRGTLTQPVISYSLFTIHYSPSTSHLIFLFSFFPFHSSLFTQSSQDLCFLFANFKNEIYPHSVDIIMRRYGM